MYLNFVKVFTAWLENTAANPLAQAKVSLWDLQVELLTKNARQGEYAIPREVLRDRLLAQMGTSPVPEMIWREAPGSVPGLNGEEPPKVVLGLVGAMMDDKPDPLIMFGGARRLSGGDASVKTVHGCPGYEMAVGVMLGMLTTLLLAGTLRPTASPTIVTWVT